MTVTLLMYTTLHVLSVVTSMLISLTLNGVIVTWYTESTFLKSVHLDLEMTWCWFIYSTGAWLVGGAPRYKFAWTCITWKPPALTMAVATKRYIQGRWDARLDHSTAAAGRNLHLALPTVLQRITFSHYFFVYISFIQNISFILEWDLSSSRR
jgi:hypothetical protein